MPPPAAVGPPGSPPPRPPPAGPSSRAALVRKIASFALGAGLLVLLLFHSGLDEVGDRFDELGWNGPLVLIPYLLIAALDVLGWRCTFPPRAVANVPLRTLYFTRLAGEAVNSMTPTATVGGEPLKV